jgi:hypothetical protein
MKGLNKNVLFAGATLGVVALAIYFYNKKNKGQGSTTPSNNSNKKSNSGYTPTGVGWAMFEWKEDITIPTYSKDSNGKLVEKGKVKFKKGDVSRFKSGSFTVNKDFSEAKLENGDIIKIYDSYVYQLF